jgi:homoserine kinase type II
VGTAGFSGATVWRGEADGESHFALKRWPGWVTANHLRQIHAWMTAARTAGCAFVPTVLPTLSNNTVLTTADGCWDVTTWMPGRADFRTNSTPERLAAACEAVAAVHRAWAGLRTGSAPCPGVTRRLLLLDTWSTRRGSFDFGGHPELARSLAVVAERIEACRAKLLPWRTIPVPTFPCHTDLWHDNILFTGNRVTGVIDYGAMKIDSPAVDLARMLGDLVGPHSPRFDEGLKAYQTAGPPVAVPAELVRVLSETGIVCAVANWHLRLDRRPAPPYFDRIVERIGTLVRAMIPE